MTQSRALKTREDIVQAAARLFALHGCSATSLNDLLDAVAVSKGAFYYHFKSKDDLVRAVLERLGHQFELEVLAPVRALGPADSAGRSLHAFFERLVELNESGQWQNCRLLARLTQEMALHPGELAQQVAALLQWWTGCWQELIAAAQQAGAIRRDLDARPLAPLLVCAWLGTVGCGDLHQPAPALGRLADTLLRLLSAAPAA